MIPLLNRGGVMKGFVQGAYRQQTTLLPECLDDWVDESNPVRAVDVFVDALELGDLGFDGVDPAATGRPAYHPSPMPAECRKIAERKMGEAVGDRRHGKELKATAQAWLVLAERIAQAEAIEALKAKGK